MRFTVTIQHADGTGDTWQQAKAVAVDPNIRVLIVTDENDRHWFFPLEQIRFWTKEQTAVVQ